ncbi:MAG: YjjG family noncanonical pyrimidine nucleotidase [Oscillospiraceae bacterium]|nr:YjjG family noncanonical pyrimidine nucleotidase [Oscillospiraceae bacterium]
MKFDTILWDVDGTLLNFEAAEEKSLRDGLRACGIGIDDAQMALYKQINRLRWERLERGEIDRQTVYISRFTDFFGRIGARGIDPERFNEDFQRALGENYVWENGARDVCEALHGRCRMYAVTNGSAVAQHRKLEGSGLIGYLDDVFISEEMGAEKPDPRYFALCTARIPAFDPRKSLIVGDSLTSDIRGGNNAGIAACWYNPKRSVNNAGVRVDYEIGSLSEVPGLLGL